MRTGNRFDPAAPASRDAEFRTLIDVIAHWATVRPAHLALTFLAEGGGESAEQSISFAQLDRQARAIASSLLGVCAPGDRALLLFAPGLEYVLGFLGCLYAGVVAVPAYPPDPMRLGRSLPRLAMIGQDAEARVTLTTSSLLAIAEQAVADTPGLRGMRWFAVDALADAQERNFGLASRAPESLAFIQYTSGSTGEPKGVMLSHGNLLANLALIQRNFGVREGSVIVSWLPPYHDMGLIGTILGALYCGSRAILMSPLSFLQRPARWLEAITQYQGSISGAPNFAYELCVRKVTQEERALLDLSCWQLAFTGAEQVRADTLARFAEAFAGCGFRRQAFLPCYGLAEATLLVSGMREEAEPTIHAVSAKHFERRQIVPVRNAEGARTFVACGRCSPEQEVAIVDSETGQPCGADQVGEIWVRGPSVARGYWRRAAETEQIFQARLPARSEAPYLRTGDLGFLHEGHLYIAGRLKDLIIIRGKNHYPQDIEASVERADPALRPGCGAAFSIDAAGEERVVIVHEVDLRRVPEPASLLTHIRQQVSEAHGIDLYAIALIAPGTISKTTSGKTQRHACKRDYLADVLQVVAAWTATAAPGQADFGATALQPPAPESMEELEPWLRVAVAAWLGLTALDPGAPLTSQGLDSLRAFQVANSLERSLGIACKGDLLLQGINLRELAVWLRARFDRRAAEAPTAKPAPQPLAFPLPRPEALPLSFSEEFLYGLARQHPNSGAWNVTAMAHARGTIDLEALSSALRDLVARHELLRTCYSEGSTGPVRCIRRDVALPWRIEDLSDRVSDPEHEEVRTLIQHEVDAPFRIDQAPLFRGMAVRLAADDHILVFVFHHIIIDGWSTKVFFRELSALYARQLEAAMTGQGAVGTPVELLPHAVNHYTDYAVWHRQWMSSRYAAGRDYWVTELNGVRPLVLRGPPPPAAAFEGATLGFQIDESLVAALERVAASHGCTMFAVLVTAFSMLLRRYTDQEDLLLATSFANRRRTEFENMLGCFVNRVPLRIRTAEDLAATELLHRTREMLLGAYEYHDFPYNRLLEELRSAEVIGANDPVRVMIVYHNMPASPVGLPGVTLKEMGANAELIRFDLSLDLVPDGRALRGSFEFRRSLFTLDEVRDMKTRLLSVLVHLAAESEQTVDELLRRADVSVRETAA